MKSVSPPRSRCSRSPPPVCRRPENRPVHLRRQRALDRAAAHLPDARRRVRSSTPRATSIPWRSFSPSGRAKGRSSGQHRSLERKMSKVDQPPRRRSSSTTEPSWSSSPAPSWTVLIWRSKNAAPGLPDAGCLPPQRTRGCLCPLDRSDRCGLIDNWSKLSSERTRLRAYSVHPRLHCGAKAAT